MSTDTARTSGDLSAFLGYFVRFVPGGSTIEVNTDPGTPSLGVLSRTYMVGTVRFGEYSDGPDIQKAIAGAPWALGDKLTNDAAGKAVPVVAAEIVHGVATKAALAGTLGLMQPFDSGASEGGDGGNIPAKLHVYISLTGSDANDGSLGAPFATLAHALDSLGLARKSILVEYLDIGTYPPISTQIQNGPMGASGTSDEGATTGIIGPFKPEFALVTSAPSDPAGVFLPTGVPAVVDQYRGLLIKEFFGRVAGNDAAGVLRLNTPAGLVPPGTALTLVSDGAIQPIEAGFGILPNGATRFRVDFGVELKFSDAPGGMFVEIFGSGLGSTLELSGTIRCSEVSGFCGMGVFNTDLEVNGGVIIGDKTGTSFCVIAGNNSDWNRQIAFSGAVCTDFLLFHSPGILNTEYTSFRRVSGIVETANYNSNNTTSADAYPLFGESCWRIGIHASYQWNSDTPGLDTVSNLAGGSGVGIDIQTNSKMCVGGPLVMNCTNVGIDVERGQLSVRPSGSLTITAPKEVQVSGIGHPAVDVTTGIGIIDLSTLSSATPGE